VTATRWAREETVWPAAVRVTRRRSWRARPGGVARPVVGHSAEGRAESPSRRSFLHPASGGRASGCESLFEARTEFVEFAVENVLALATPRKPAGDHFFSGTCRTGRWAGSRSAAMCTSSGVLRRPWGRPEAGPAHNLHHGPLSTRPLHDIPGA
jgi:hypothetical protein